MSSVLQSDFFGIGVRAYLKVPKTINDSNASIPLFCYDVFLYFVPFVPSILNLFVLLKDQMSRFVLLTFLYFVYTLYFTLFLHTIFFD